MYLEELCLRSLFKARGELVHRTDEFVIRCRDGRYSADKEAEDGDAEMHLERITQ
jgi:hypothetical protein